MVKDGDKFTFNTASTFKNTSISFKLGEEFDEETIDGRKVKSVITLDGNTMNHKQGGEPASDIVREFSADECKVTMNVKDVKCVRTYKAV